MFLSERHWLLLFAGFILVLHHVTATLDNKPLARGAHMPIYALERSQTLNRRVPGTGAVGLGDFKDVAYNVLLKIGNISLPLLLDSGSSDLWAISDECKKNCSQGLPVYPRKAFKYSGVDARLFYGDSASGTYAFGPVGKDNVTLAGLTSQNQYFAAINQTDTTIVGTGSAGILGLGFPVNSVIWNGLFNHQYPSSTNTTTTTTTTMTTSKHQSTMLPRQEAQDSKDSQMKENIRSRALQPSRFFDFGGLQNLATVDQLLNTFITNGPVVARMGFSGQLLEPSFSITLQRDSFDIGGNVGMLSIGELPSGVKNESLTWVPVRKYTADQGGIPASSAAPNEVYPISWEVPIDNVYLDGKVLPQSALSTGVTLSALIDSGNSLIRGPRDVVAAIYKDISGSNTTNSYDCGVAHALEFEIGGHKFPVDPRDFGWQAEKDSVQYCNSSIVATDPPTKGFLYAWSLGAPFLKSVLASFYYGNLTHPSVDPPRVGFVSTVPDNAKDLFAAALKSASSNFPDIVEPPLDHMPNISATGVAGVALAPTFPFESSSTSDLGHTSIITSGESLSAIPSSTPPPSKPPSSGSLPTFRCSVHVVLCGALLSFILPLLS